MYSVMKNIISLEHAEILASIVRSQPVKKGDDTVPDSYSYYNLPEVNILLGLLCERVSANCGKKLLPTYSYTRVYKNGTELKKHTDRPSCEWSVTINLSQDTPWPIFMGGTELTLGVGDGCVYQGCLIEHWRTKFTGKEYIQVFLHYVDENGPYKVNWYDAEHKKADTALFSYKYISLNNTIDWWQSANVFNTQECTQIINMFKNNVNKSTVGDGKIKENLRKSQNNWIIKTKDNHWIYHKIFEAVGFANDTFFNLKISELGEEIQFTKYSEDEYYNWHIDFTPENNRKLSASVQLSDSSDYEGGELEFGPDMGVASKDQGTVIVFPSFMSHRVKPVTRGTRYSLVAWITGPPLQ